MRWKYRTDSLTSFQISIKPKLLQDLNLLLGCYLLKLLEPRRIPILVLLVQFLHSHLLSVRVAHEGVASVVGTHQNDHILEEEGVAEHELVSVVQVHHVGVCFETRQALVEQDQAEHKVGERASRDETAVFRFTAPEQGEDLLQVLVRVNVLAQVICRQDLGPYFLHGVMAVVEQLIDLFKLLLVLWVHYL